MGPLSGLVDSKDYESWTQKQCQQQQLATFSDPYIIPGHGVPLETAAQHGCFEAPLSAQGDRHATNRPVVLTKQSMLSFSINATLL